MKKVISYVLLATLFCSCNSEDIDLIPANENGMEKNKELKSSISAPIIKSSTDGSDPTLYIEWSGDISYPKMQVQYCLSTGGGWRDYHYGGSFYHYGSNSSSNTLSLSLGSMLKGLINIRMRLVSADSQSWSSWSRDITLNNRYGFEEEMNIPPNSKKIEVSVYLPPISYEGYDVYEYTLYSSSGYKKSVTTKDYFSRTYLYVPASGSSEVRLIVSLVNYAYGYAVIKYGEIKEIHDPSYSSLLINVRSDQLH